MLLYSSGRGQATIAGKGKYENDRSHCICIQEAESKWEVELGYKAPGPAPSDPLSAMKLCLLEGLYPS